MRTQHIESYWIILNRSRFIVWKSMIQGSVAYPAVCDHQRAQALAFDCPELWQLTGSLPWHIRIHSGTIKLTAHVDASYWSVCNVDRFDFAASERCFSSSYFDLNISLANPTKFSPEDPLDPSWDLRRHHFFGFLQNQTCRPMSFLEKPERIVNRQGPWEHYITYITVSGLYIYIYIHILYMDIYVYIYGYVYIYTVYRYM